MRFLKVSALMAAMLFSAVAMLGVLSMRGLPVRGGSIPGATTNGDVNCDGRVDLSDAISIIQYSFYGGTPPCALASQEDIEARITALETASKKEASVATGTYVGDGKFPRTITTGLQGKVVSVQIFQAGVDHPNVEMIASQGLSNSARITTSGGDFILNNTSGFEFLNLTGQTLRWIAFTSPE
jgi:hypothetical protein